MAAGSTELTGGKFRLFSSNSGQKTTSGCVITAHGTQAFVTPDFKTPATMDIYFYSPQGSAIRAGVIGKKNKWQIDAASAGISTKNVTPSGPPVSGGDICPNYVLSKLQKSTTGFMGGAPTNWVMDRFNVSYSQIEAFLNHFPHAMDILTVRSRPFGIEATLKDAVKALDGMGYTEVHCSFCRVPMLCGELPFTDLTGARPQ